MRRILLTCCAAAGLLAPAARAGLPQWYQALGLPAADTDGDGIPDAWEKRTFSDPAVPDAHLDRDGDGLTDLEEFAFGSDPRSFSTMGDLWPDLEKRGAGLDAAFRVVPAAGPAQWQAWLGWSGQEWLALTATNAAGFTGAYAAFIAATPPYSDGDGTVDFWLETRTDRAAWLTVADALTTNAFPVRAGSGRVRLRAAYGGPVTLTLDPLPGSLAGLPGATNGPWLCAMSVLPARSNTVVFADGQTPPQAPGDPDSVDGLLLASPPPAGAVRALSAPPPGLTLQPLRVTDGVLRLGDGGWYCMCWSEPPCAWPDYGMVAGPVDAALHGWNEAAPLLDKWDAWDLYWEQFPRVECTVTQTVASAVYPFLYGKVVFSFRPCDTGPSGICGAEHAADHEPRYLEVTGCGGIGGVCTGDPLQLAGFGHSLVNTRNLFHPDEPQSDKLYQHCVGLVWDGQAFDLSSLCESGEYDIRDHVVWEVNGVHYEGPLLDLGPEPADLEPSVFRVRLLEKNAPGVVWDRLILVVSNRGTKAEYDSWVALWSAISNRTWLAELPAAYSSLGPNNSDPEPNGDTWFSPKKPGSYYHHLSILSMRSKKTNGGHANQACYKSDGQLELSGVNAGTADYRSTDYGFFAIPHRNADVYPFIRALQLDGNPVRPTSITVPTDLDHPLMFQGGYIEQYLFCRPITP